MHASLRAPLKWAAFALVATMPLSAVADEKTPEPIYDQMRIFADVLALVPSL